MPLGKSLSTFALVAVLTVAVTTAGLVAFWPSEAQSETRQPIGHNASERLAELDGLTATVETTIHLENETNQTRRRVWMRPGTRELRSRTLGDGPSTLTVSNGSTYWVYHPAENNATRLDVGGYNAASQQRGERIERIFTRLNVSRGDREESVSASITPGSAPLPSVPAGTGSVTTPSQPTVEATDQFGLHYNGTATVSGREVYVVSIRAPDTDENASVLEDYQQTMYVDSEYFLPIKTHTEWRSDDRRIESTTVYRNLTFNPGFDDSRFQFDPPANVTVVETEGPSVHTFESVATARANTSLPMPTPDIPSSFALDSVQVVSGNFSSVSLQYSNETAALTLSVNNVSNVTAEQPGQRLTVDGRVLYYRQFGTSHAVSWQCDDYRYSVSGTAVGKDRLLDIAASMECP